MEESVTVQSTASLLAVLIDKLFSDSKTEKKELSGVVVASGPGSYTGLRIGVATAKGICYALNIPLISVNTLYLLAYQVKKNSNSDSFLCPMLDARRMEVYCTLFDPSLNVVEPTQALVVNEKSFADQLDRNTILFFGEGSDKCESIIKHTNAQFITGVRPSAAALGEIGFHKFATLEIEDLEHFEPFYLKDFVVKKPNSVS
ncbi:tRNA (adenosine(37)-N6)-threonylcarbamoyltransferase complex dimerization subunit type 1 TsaB [Cytophagales bacterium WSM2-2]|nr:tRNA (adenosine(37)-N6)-threonylcarbamoyltransferase complex dimerization subunit type 1 TsaB [Cytophagales bacterium WSM2-2]